MSVGHAEALDRAAFEVDLDHHYRLVADDPAVMTRLDADDVRRSMLDDAAVRVLDVNLAMREEPDVGVLAVVTADRRLHVLRPAEAHRVDQALDAGCTGAADFQLHVADVAAFSACDRTEEPDRPNGWDGACSCRARLLRAAS